MKQKHIFLLLLLIGQLSVYAQTDKSVNDASSGKNISWVDASLDGSEKFVLRVKGVPFYMTNIQVRLDKLYRYYGWNEKELETVIKRAKMMDSIQYVCLRTHY